VKKLDSEVFDGIVAGKRNSFHDFSASWECKFGLPFRGLKFTREMCSDQPMQKEGEEMVPGVGVEPT